MEDEVIKEIIEMVIHAPSASNRQDWKFLVMNLDQIKDDICKGLGACWICKLTTQRRIRKLLEISKYYDTIKLNKGMIEML